MGELRTLWWLPKGFLWVATPTGAGFGASSITDPRVEGSNVKQLLQNTQDNLTSISRTLQELRSVRACNPQGAAHEALTVEAMSGSLEGKQLAEVEEKLEKMLASMENKLDTIDRILQRASDRHKRRG